MCELLEGEAELLEVRAELLEVRAELLEREGRHSLLALSSARSRHDQTVLEDQITIARCGHELATLPASPALRCPPGYQCRATFRLPQLKPKSIN